MAFCRKICCCDWSEDRNKELHNNNNNSVEMKSQQPYSPTPNYGRDQRASSLLSNPATTGSTTSPGGSANNNSLHDPLMSPSVALNVSDPLAATAGAGDGLPMSPLMLSNHNASFASIRSTGSPANGAGGGRKRGVSFAPKGFEQPKSTTTSVQSNGQVKGIYRHRSSYGIQGGDGNSSMMMMTSPHHSEHKLSPGHSSATQKALGSPYAGADATGGREPPDLSLL